MLKKIISNENLKFTLINIIAIITGILYSYSITSNYLNSGLIQNNVTFNDLNYLFSKNVFFQIFFSNLRTLLIIIFCGFFTGGIVSFLVILWNTFLVCIIIFQTSTYNTNYDAFTNFFFHGVFEIPAFIIASNIGLRGFEFYKKIYCKNVFDNKLYPKFKEIIILIGLLLIAAFIETLMVK